MKPKTVKDLEIKHGERYGMCSYCIERVKEEAIKFLIYTMKKEMNPFKAFMRFHNITEEDIYNATKEDLK